MNAADRERSDPSPRVDAAAGAARVARYAEAIYGPKPLVIRSGDDTVAAVVAVADEERAADRAEIERLRAHLPSDAFLSLIERSSLGAEDVREARAHVSRDAASALVRWADEMAARETAEARLDALVADLRWLADDMDERGRPGASDSPMDAQSRRQVREDVKRLRAVLDKHAGEVKS